MWKYTAEVRGMVCGMCEAHVNDAIRRAFPATKVRSSRRKNQTVVLTETELDPQALADTIRAAGYDAGAVRKAPFEKKRLFR